MLNRETFPIANVLERFKTAFIIYNYHICDFLFILRLRIAFFNFLELSLDEKKFEIFNDHAIAGKN
jgi:hypothetical protein